MDKQWGEREGGRWARVFRRNLAGKGEPGTPFPSVHRPGPPPQGEACVTAKAPLILTGFHLFFFCLIVLNHFVYDAYKEDAGLTLREGNLDRVLSVAASPQKLGLGRCSKCAPQSRGHSERGPPRPSAEGRTVSLAATLSCRRLPRVSPPSFLLARRLRGGFSPRGAFHKVQAEVHGLKCLFARDSLANRTRSGE